ncbi:hypothetical protein ACFE04_025177 [Oxalis oulophora]
MPADAIISYTLAMALAPPYFFIAMDCRDRPIYAECFVIHDISVAVVGTYFDFKILGREFVETSRDPTTTLSCRYTYTIPSYLWNNADIYYPQLVKLMDLDH